MAHRPGAVYQRPANCHAGAEIRIQTGGAERHCAVQKTRLPKDPATNKPEPLLTFKRGALVHFAVSQYDVFMTTKLAGDSTFFLPFNKGTKDGGAGNEIPKIPTATPQIICGMKCCCRTTY